MTSPLASRQPAEKTAWNPIEKREETMMMRYSYAVGFIAIVAVSLAPNRAFSQAPSPSLMQLESKIPLGDVKGRIDHLAIDLSRRRLFVAELGNDTVSVVDLNEQKVKHVITGLKEPQGIGYVPSSDTLFVANAGDGSVLLFEARITRQRDDWIWEMMPTTFASMPRPIEFSSAMAMAHLRRSTRQRTARSPTFHCRLTRKVFSSPALPGVSS
jgi:YVTN family beta-propeller protein